jgi:hypothetical protein
MLEYLARERRRLRHGTRAFTREVNDGLARIFVDHGFQWDGSNNVWLTRARASFVMSTGPQFDIRPRSLISRMLGIHCGVSSGDPCFDDFFVVRTDEPEPTWAALTTRVRSVLASAFEDARLLSNGSMVSMWREGDFGREADAEAAVEVVSEIVHLHCDVLDSLRRLPGAVFEPPRGGWDERTVPSVRLHTPVAVDIGPMKETRSGAIGATAECGRTVRPFQLEIDESGDVRGNQEQFPIGAAAALRQVGRATVKCDGTRLSLCWHGLERRRERLLAGAHLIGAFAATQSASLYR